MDGLALELYRREGHDLDSIASQRQNNPLSFEENPELELLSPGSQLEWSVSANLLFLERLGLDTSRMSNYEPNYFSHLAEQNPQVFAKAVVLSQEGQDELTMVEKLVGPKPKAGVEMPDFSLVPPGND